MTAQNNCHGHKTTQEIHGRSITLQGQLSSTNVEDILEFDKQPKTNR